MEKQGTIKLLELLLLKYNEQFWSIASIVILIIIFVALYLFLEHTQNSDERWYTFIAVLHNAIGQVIVAGIFVFLLIVFLKEVLYIEIVENRYIKLFWKVILGIFFWRIIQKGKRLYKEVNFSDNLEKIKSKKYFMLKPADIMNEYIDSYQVNCSIEREKIGILKSLAPVSLIPVIFGYILEGKSVDFNLNGYTIFFLAAILMYLFLLWRSMEMLRFWEKRIVKVKAKLRTLDEIQNS